ncbi:ACYP1 [Scenedesmus sp. PABB004]|nr:ACYP1 [Scenedesmus sp. PABB004]
MEAFRFEVSGRVQGVYFRNHTVDRARALHLVGWVANTRRGTVVGECQGSPPDLAAMREWLATEGSPMSHIDSCSITDERRVAALEHDSFERRPTIA